MIHALEGCWSWWKQSDGSAAPFTISRETGLGQRTQRPCLVVYFKFLFCVHNMLRLDPGGRREKGQTGRDGLKVFIVDYSSVKCTYSA